MLEIKFQEDSEIQLKSIAEFLESSENSLHNRSYGYEEHVFFGQVQPVMMEALVQRGIYKSVLYNSPSLSCTSYHIR